MKELFEVFTNWRFWSFIIIAFLPVWYGLIATILVLLKGAREDEV